MTSQMKLAIERRNELTAKVKNILIDRLSLKAEPNEITEDAPLFGMGLALDSIDALVLIVGIEDEFDISLNTTDHQIYRSINTLVDHLIGVEVAQPTHA